jgi:hypothetical protein
MSPPPTVTCKYCCSSSTTNPHPIMMYRVCQKFHNGCRNTPLEKWVISLPIAQAVSRRLPTATARVRAQVRPCGIFGGQSGTGAGFLQVLLFPLPILIRPSAPHSSPIIRGWYNRPISGRRTKWTQSHPTPRNKKKILSYWSLGRLPFTTLSAGKLHGVEW